MNIGAGLSEAFIEGGKDLIAIVKYLGDKEMQEKKLGLEKERLQATKEYQGGLLQNMARQSELANKRYDLDRLKAETASDAQARREEALAMNAGWQQREADLKEQAIKAKIQKTNLEMEKIKKEMNRKETQQAYTPEQIKTGFTMASTMLKNFLNAYSRTLNVPADVISQLGMMMKGDTGQAANVIEGLKQSRYESLPIDKKQDFLRLLAKVEEWYNRYANLGQPTTPATTPTVAPPQPVEGVETTTNTSKWKTIIHSKAR